MSTPSHRQSRPAKRQYGSAAATARRLNIQTATSSSLSSSPPSSSIIYTSSKEVSLGCLSSTSGPSSDNDLLQGSRPNGKSSTPPTSPRSSAPLSDFPTNKLHDNRHVKIGLKGKERATAPVKSDLRSFFTRVTVAKRKRAVSDSDDENSIAEDRRTAPSLLTGRSGKTGVSNVTASDGKAMRKVTSKPQMEQLYLDPFSSTGHATLSCNVCGMSYARTPDDMALHSKHHKKVTGGCEWVSPSTEDTCKSIVVIEDNIDWDGTGNGGGRVLMVDAKAEGVVGRRVKDILATIDTELSSAGLSEEQLESSKLFLLVTPSRKVVACAVIQRIREAYEVVDAATRAVGSPVSSSTHSTKFIRFGEEEDEGAIFCASTPVPVLLGVHRIWTSSSQRRRGLASILLDASAARCIYGAPIVKARRARDVAFSQPTGKGKALARNWTGADNFRVFVE